MLAAVTPRLVPGPVRAWRLPRGPTAWFIGLLVRWASEDAATVFTGDTCLQVVFVFFRGPELMNSPTKKG